MTQGRWSILVKGQENTRTVPVAKDFNTEKNARKMPSLANAEASSVRLDSERTCFLIPEVIDSAFKAICWELRPAT